MGPKILSQNDPRWSSIPLGDKTIGDYGCTTTCISMFLSAMAGDGDITPDKLVERMNQLGGYDSLGEINWPVLNQAVQGLYFLGRDYVIHPGVFCISKDLAMTRIKKNIRIGQFPLIEVRAGTSQHWVIGVQDIPQGILVNDPGHGDQVLLQERYKDVYGLARLFGPAVMAPDGDACVQAWKAHEMLLGKGLDVYPKEIFLSFTE